MTIPLLPQSLKLLLPQEIHAEAVGSFYGKNDCLFKTGLVPEWMFFVVSGEVTLERIGLQGEAVVLQRCRTGFVSEASLGVARYHCDAVAVSDTVTIKLPMAQLASHLDKDPKFASRWIGMLNSELRRLRLQCQRLTMKSVRERLLHLIHSEGKNGQFPVPSGLKTLAGELGVTHEALYRCISLLEKSGVISKSNGVLTVQKN
jgi:CRP/FNR family transcriptional regulator, dissimilatory nitrate respiration regulator